MIDRARLILVFGISGVGKTTRCVSFARSHKDYLYERASAILQSALGKIPEALRTADPRTIEANQSALPISVARLRDSNPGATILLDAHAVIDNDLELVEVPIETIKDLQPDGLILLEADEITVAHRRTSDSRLRPERTLSQIRLEAQAERRTVEKYAKALNISMTRAEAINDWDFEDAINRIFPRSFRRKNTDRNEKN